MSQKRFTMLFRDESSMASLNVLLDKELLYSTVIVFLGLITLYCLLQCLYNEFLHPLAGFPGPRKATLAPFWSAYQWHSGDYVRTIKSLHDQYGPVVRFAPNQLSFCSSTSWKDIYGSTPNRKPFLKSGFYEPFPGEAENVLTACHPARHAAMRKSLSHGFSTRALEAQEELMHDYINLFIEQIEKNGSNESLDMVNWFNYLTFDVIGELAFGDPFGCVESGTSHFWIDILFAGVKTSNLIRSFEFLPWIRSSFRKIYGANLLPEKIRAPRLKQWLYANEKIQKRLKRIDSRPDFLHKLIAEGKETGVSDAELISQANLLVIAGSETTATALSGITYHLCRNRRVYNALAREIRSSFALSKEIDARSTDSLPYLKAVIDEGLRIFPPVPTGLPRISPGETVDGLFVPKGCIVSVSSWAATHSESSFSNPFEFRPERWIDPDCKDQKSASQPFLLGSRGCLGRNLAHLELRLILAKIFWNFDFELMDDDLDWDAANKTYLFWEKPKLPIRFHTFVPAKEGLEDQT